ncbi:hypothetical protein [Streptomyces sp. Mo3]|uniref:hypothetical protein n=1 Tax=Streptomyces sp. Mo3 TaxID=3161190 RepID=UPI0039EF4BD9
MSYALRALSERRRSGLQGRAELGERRPEGGEQGGIRPGALGEVVQVPTASFTVSQHG